MGKRSWWQRSLNRHFRLLEAKSARAVEQRRTIEEEWIKTQKKRALEPEEKEFKRVGKAFTDADALGRKKIAKELTWRTKWNTRKAKFDILGRKYR